MRRRKEFGRWMVLGAVAGAVSTLVGSRASGQTNLLLDPGFEAGIAGAPDATAGDVPMSTSGPWLGWNNWLAPYSGYYTQSVPAHSGTQVGKTFSGPNGGIYQFINVIPGDTYTASAWFLNSTTDALNGPETDDVRMIFFGGDNGAGANLGTFVTPTPVSDLTPSNTWTQLSVSQVAPAGAEQVQWMAFFNNPNGSGGAMFVDDTSLIDTTPVWSGLGTNNDWSAGSNWEGTAPTAASNLIFDGNTQLNSQNDFASGTVFGGIRFNSTAGAFVLSGNSIGLGGDIVNNSPSLQTINLGLALQQNTNLNAAAGNIAIGGAITGGFSITANGSNIVTLSGNNTYSGGTNVAAGKMVISAHSALPANSAVAISPSATLQLASGVGTESVSSLSISPGGTLDINNNAILINYAGGPDPISSVVSMIVSGYAGGAWTGAGIMSTTAQTNSGSYGIGYADSNDPGNPAGLASGQIEVMYTLLGDANLDGKVNGADFTILASHFNQSVTNGWDEGDFNYDGDVNGADFTLLAANFNQSAVGAADLAALDDFAAANGISLTSVPEPTSFGLIMLAGAAVLRRSRRGSR